MSSLMQDIRDGYAPDALRDIKKLRADIDALLAVVEHTEGSEDERMKSDIEYMLRVVDTWLAACKNEPVKVDSW